MPRRSYGFVGNDGVNNWDYLGFCTDGSCKIDIIAFSDLKYQICFKMAGHIPGSGLDAILNTDPFESVADNGKICIESPTLADLIPDFPNGAEAIKSAAVKYGASWALKQKVKSDILKQIGSSALSGIRAAGFIQAEINSFVDDIELNVKGKAIYKYCKCKGSKWGGWSWLNREMSVVGNLDSITEPARGLDMVGVSLASFFLDSPLVTEIAENAFSMIEAASLDPEAALINAQSVLNEIVTRKIEEKHECK